jgi:hypothetical protein
LVSLTVFVFLSDLVAIRAHVGVKLRQAHYVAKQTTRTAEIS